MHTASAKSTSNSVINILNRQLELAEQRRQADLKAAEECADQRRREDLKTAEERADQRRREDLEAAEMRHQVALDRAEKRSQDALERAEQRWQHERIAMQENLAAALQKIQH